MPFTYDMFKCFYSRVRSHVSKLLHATSHCVMREAVIEGEREREREGERGRERERERE